MPATASRSKKSEAYETGIREGRAMAARARNPEASEPEEEEEEEETDMAASHGTNQKGHSRRRSAKGAENTKPAKDGGMYGKKPMDAECGCSGRKGGKCDGNCGSMRKRGDSLTPLEYLDACELGIQDRSPTYIRARLDTAERLDLKCGKGSISEGEKCTKGPAQRVQPKKANKSSNSGAKKALLAGAVIGGAAVLGAGLDIRAARRKAAQGALTQLKQNKRSANTVFTTQLGTIAKANKQSPNNPRLQQASFRAAMQAKGYRDLKRREIKQGLANLKAQVPKSPARRRAARRRGDSIYAEGFSDSFVPFDI
jgi:hypothetical protein